MKFLVELRVLVVLIALCYYFFFLVSYWINLCGSSFNTFVSASCLSASSVDEVLRRNLLTSTVTSLSGDYKAS
ncbi:hypothetical protein P167DRAFT_533458 [Morchella conica CCBAS932]|uniref:Uncharacterized protein n=1 Tax=Morchella conica CCBAS932 TaxID=1392247 RepID=A0A3N4KXK8_9PEZI|nr:hypothetical protein P167DRAFT_533458 [Morchella conica CCBAS932]